MDVVYIDDSKDERLCVYSALSIPSERWRTAYSGFKAFRSDLLKSDGIRMATEFHATDFIAGRGSLGHKTLFKGRRCQIYGETLAFIASIPGASLINALGPPKHERKVFEYLLTRINTAARKRSTEALVVCDKGQEANYTRLARKLSAFNLIPSKRGAWEGGATAKNIPNEHIVEDIIFKDSRESYFVQLVDFCAFALLRRENPNPRKAHLGIHEAFGILAPILNRNACGHDPEGIVRC